jgi:tetratricopeptide (TPR) repeat protein
VALRELGRAEEEAESNERALRIDPDFVPALLSKAWMMEQSGEMAKALTCYERITKVDPSHGRGWYGMGFVLFNGFQHYRQARACLERARELGYALADEALAICAEVLDH